MAIYDDDGTATREIGKLYDNDRTTTYQIGKAYDNDGTNSYLIYSAEDYLLQNGVVQSLAGGFTHYAQQYNSALTYQNGYMELRNTNSGSYSLVRSNNQIPWGNYSKLYIQMAKTEIPYTDCRIALDKNGTSNIYRWMTSQDNNTMSLFTTYWTPNWPENTIITIDISNISTSGWFMFGLTGNVGWWRMKNIWVE